MGGDASSQSRQYGFHGLPVFVRKVTKLDVDLRLVAVETNHAQNEVWGSSASGLAPLGLLGRWHSMLRTLKGLSAR